MNKELKSKILSFASNLGIPAVGISGDGKTYSNIVCLFPYYTGDSEKSNLSLYAQSRDYHIICTEYLRKMEAYILSVVPNAKTKLHVDIGDGNDKNEAYRAGLGFYGENSLIIHPTFGSFAFIGYISTNLTLSPDAPMHSTCLHCGLCAQKCPGKAIREGKIIIENCASYISQKRGELAENEKRILRKSGLIWGCDACQTVCPHNKNIPLSPIKEFYDAQIHSLPSLEISNTEFKKQYGDRAFSWRGKNVLARNMEIISNYKK